MDKFMGRSAGVLAVLAASVLSARAGGEIAPVRPAAAPSHGGGPGISENAAIDAARANVAGGLDLTEYAIAAKRHAGPTFLYGDVHSEGS